MRKTLKRCEGDGMVMRARRVKQAVDDIHPDTFVFCWAGGTWQAEDGELVFLNTHMAPVDKIGTRKVLLALQSKSEWCKPQDDAFITFWIDCD